MAVTGGRVTALSVVVGGLSGLRPATKTVHGATVADWSVDPVETVTVKGCSVQPAGGTEDRGHRDQTGGAIHLFAPAGTAIGSLDRVWLPDYPDQHWRSATQPQVWSAGFLDHVQYQLVAWEG
jgi:hypothetical protein